MTHRGSYRDDNGYRSGLISARIADTGEAYGPDDVRTRPEHGGRRTDVRLPSRTTPPTTSVLAKPSSSADPNYRRWACG
jgi:hypothetical protein